jgi:hypothetical protein
MIDTAPETQNEKHAAAHHNFNCKPPVFPKYATGDNMDSHFTQLERYLRLSKVPEFAQIDFALLSIPQYANWWDSFTTTRNDSIPITWELFKTTMTTFMTGPSPAHTAMSRLLALKQSTFSADKYSRMFMNLVRQSKTPPTQGWLVHHFLMGLTDNELRRQLTATRSIVWNNLTSLIQHMSHILSFEVVQSDNNWNTGMTVHNDGSEFPEFNEPSYHKFQLSHPAVH